MNSKLLFQMPWFKALMGFREENPDNVRNNCFIEEGQDGTMLVSRVNNRRIGVGAFETPSLADLRSRTSNISKTCKNSNKLQYSTVIGKVENLHEENPQALFQVASQFNVLEMVSPALSPERGVEIYAYDATQGPACAIAAGGGTIYRNYFVPLGDGSERIGQSKDHQINCLADIGELLNNQDNSLWTMENGYVVPTYDGLDNINQKLMSASEAFLDQVRSSLRVGIHWDVEVTRNNKGHRVAQVYCSAMPVAYSRQSAAKWEHISRLILEAAYEATFHAALSHQAKTGKNVVFLTKLGGGAFGNKSAWISDAIDRSVKLFSDYDLDVRLVRYG
mmetsp:Transcript_9867/g.10935  ORF Transcript_9867/g.10935 Transcript_9867/m.10935 type:complete len:334 (+) Transcript_9867:156-1157(+)